MTPTEPDWLTCSDDDIDNYIFKLKSELKRVKQALRILGASIERGDPQHIADECLQIKGRLGK
jgi:ribosomal 50S subunit-associated protein YjgA (DUF615 family)